jgi:predicted acyltransferase
MQTDSARLASLDVFRGLTIAAMLLVNNPGSWSFVYGPLRHAAWHGWTPTDLIFPFFLFIVGAAMAFSLRRHTEGGEPAGSAFWRRLFRRVALLLALGLLLNGFPYYDLSTIRIPGVLQRIGLVYALAAPAVVFLRPRPRAAVAVAVLLAFWGLGVLVPVGGEAPAMDPDRNLQRVVDLGVFGPEHLWGGSPTDPEGLLGTLPALVTCLLGYGAGLLLRDAGRSARTARTLAMRGLVLTSIGLVWGLVLPINKPLWTPSYVALTGGLAMVCLAACFWLIDLRGWRRWARPAEVMGLNAITAFVASGLGARTLGLIKVGGEGGAITLKQWIFEWLVSLGLRGVDASLAFAVGTVVFWWAVVALMQRRGWVLKV